MHYYKSTELSELYGVSRRTVTNWIEQTQQGRLHLELIKDGDTHYIANSPKNQLIIRSLVTERRKFLNSRSLKRVTPLPEFYELYNEDQILDIISNIDTYREIPRQYNYFESGADFWDSYVQRLSTDPSPNMITATKDLLAVNMDYLDSLLARYAKVNVIDAGMGNVLPTRALLEHLLKVGKLKRYVAIDISEKMLAIAEHNIKEWFGDTVPFEGYQRDFSFERFADIIAEPSAANDRSTVNLVLLLGGTLVNFREPEDVLKVFSKSMQRNDLFIYTAALDSPAMRARFTFSSTPDEPLPPQYKFIVDRIGIDPSYYEVEVGFDEADPARYLRIRLKHALSIEFKLKKGTWRIDLNKEETILLWRARHESTLELANQIYKSGFDPLLVSETLDHDYLMLVADLRKDGR
jgi:SAM-dependent methyltransferase